MKRGVRELALRSPGNLIPEGANSSPYGIHVVLLTRENLPFQKAISLTLTHPET